MRSSSPANSAELTRICLLSETTPFPVKRIEDIIPDVVNHYFGNVKDFSSNNSLSNGDFGSHGGSHTSSCELQERTCSVGGTEKDKLDHTVLNKHLWKLSDCSEDMLSSTVVTVLAPHWSGRVRRPKKCDGSSETGGNSQDFTNSEHILNQDGESPLNARSHVPRTVPSMGIRRNTVDWSSKSDPSSFNLEFKREMSHSVSLDPGSVSSSRTTPSTRAPYFLDPNIQRRNPQTVPQEALSSLSSKLTTSSLLLSLRKSNSNDRSSNKTSTFPEANFSHVKSFPNDQNKNMLTKQHSQNSMNTNEQDRQKSIFTPSPISYRTNETGPHLSPRSFNQKVAHEASDTAFTKQPNAVNKNLTTVTPFNHSLQTKGFSGAPQDSTVLENKSESCLDTSISSSSRQYPYGHASISKSHSLPRRPTLTSTSWWRQVSQDGNYLATNKTANIKEQSKTAVVPPFNHNEQMISLNLNNKQLDNRISRNNNPAELHLKDEMNSAVKTLSTDIRRPDKQECVSVVNKVPHKPHSMPDVLSYRISKPSVPLMPRNTKDFPKLEVSNTSLKANVIKIPPTLINPKWSDPEPETSPRHKTGDCPSRTSTLHSPNIDSQRFTKSCAFPTTVSSQVATSKPSSGFTSPNRNTFSLHLDTVSSPNPTLTCSPKTPKFVNSPTPIGFERSYACIPKPFSSKNPSSYTPTFSFPSKTNGNSVSVSSTILYGVPRTPSFSSTATSPTSTTSSLLTPPLTPVIPSPNSEASTPKGESTSCKIRDKESKKSAAEMGVKRVRRVTWEDSVDAHSLESDSVLNPPQMFSKPPSPSMSNQTFFPFALSGDTEKKSSLTFSPSSKMSSIQDKVGGKYRSLSSDCADLAARNKYRGADSVTVEEERQDLKTSRQERTLSVESGITQSQLSSSPSPSYDFSNGYKLRYSTTPYSTLMSSRQAQEEIKTKHNRFPLFSPPAQSNFTQQHLLEREHSTTTKTSMSKRPMSPVRPCLPLSIPPQNTTTMKESLTSRLSNIDRINNNHGKGNTQVSRPESQIQLLDNRVHITLCPAPGDEANGTSSTCVTETLVYSVKPKVEKDSAIPKNATPKPWNYTQNTSVSAEPKFSKQTQTVQHKEVDDQPSSNLFHSSHGTSSIASQTPISECSHKNMKDNTFGKSRFFSMEVNNEQSSRGARSGMKKSLTIPNPESSNLEPEKASKSSNKVDQMFNKLKQKFSSKRSDEDLSFPWKWRRASQTPSVSGSSDASAVSDNSTDRTKTVEEQVQQPEMVPNSTGKMEASNEESQNRFASLVPKSTGCQFAIWSEKAALEKDQNEHNFGTEQTPKTKVHLTVHTPENNQSDPELSAGRASITTAAPQCGRSTPSPRSPRSPFSPFTSLTPLSPFSPSDLLDDNVFYSPKLQRHRESTCEPGEGMSLGPRRRASTGPPRGSAVTDSNHLASSYADLKYGIEPGRSFSVRSVLSNRPSGSERISTGSRFMSVGDLSQSGLSCGTSSTDLDQDPSTPDWTKELGNKHYRQMSKFHSDPDKMRSRSLPRSWTQCLSSWNTGAPSPQRANTSKTAGLRSPNINTCHFAWDTEGPPTPPPTPPLSPAIKRMSRAPNLPSSSLPCSSGVLHQPDGLPARVCLPPKGYLSSLGTFDESSDSSSDTTTDDEYYLEPDNDGEKETEL